MANSRPRRRSIFSGLLLILVGGLLLLHNFRGELPIWILFHRWWPLVLIVWGLAKLYDHFVALRTGQVAPATITGGEVVLVILAIGLLGSVGAYDHMRSRVDIDFRPPWEETYSVAEELPAKSIPADSRITIRTDHGDITVNPEEAAEIRVVAKKTSSASSESEAQRRVQQITVAITESAGSYEIRPHSQGERVQVDLKVHVPKQASVAAWTERGNLQINGLAGAITLHGQHGDIEVRDAGGDVSADLTRGDAHIVGARGNVKLSGKGGQIEIADVKGEAVVEGEFYGPIRIERAAKGARFLSKRTDLTVSQLSGRMEAGSGRIEISDAAGNVSLSTRKYDVIIENVSGRIHIENRDGDIELRFPQPPREEVEVTNSGSGDIDLVLPAKSTFEVHAETHSGNVDCEFEGCAQHEIKQHGSTKLDWKLGTTGPQLRLKTKYGTIRLRKSQ